MIKFMKSMTVMLSGAVAGGAVVNYFNQKDSKEQDGKLDKFKGYYELLRQWLTLKQRKESLETFFTAMNYQKIAIYGMGELGTRLYEELKDSSVTVEYAIDQKAEHTNSELEIYTLEDELREVDLIVVTSIFSFEEIRDQLEKYVSYPIISLENVIFEV